VTAGLPKEAVMTIEETKIWANSGDAHVLEPNEIWTDRLPKEMAARMPRSERVDERTEIIHVDGDSFTRTIGFNPAVTEEYLEDAGKSGTIDVGERLHDRPAVRHMGTWDIDVRLNDLDKEGIWGEVVYPSIGLWNGMITDPVLYREGVKAANDWLKETFLDVTSRSVPAAEISILSVEDAVLEATRVAEMGFKALSLPTTLGDTAPNWNRDEWEPLWATAEEAGMVLGIHIGGDAKQPGDGINKMYHGPGGAVLNYVETTFGGQRAATMLVASGALDRHPNLKVLISEGGATWVPFIADRMEEGYRQHGLFVRPRLSRRPREIMHEQVYASFQHDRTAIGAYTALGYKNVLWGSDYPHSEGTYGHTQKVLHELFDDVDEDVRYHITRGAFLELFPHVGEPPSPIVESRV
jgi:predicted TIM-barrel fold metal-dependent hydrolase